MFENIYTTEALMRTRMEERMAEATAYRLLTAFTRGRMSGAAAGPLPSRRTGKRRFAFPF